GKASRDGGLYLIPGFIDIHMHIESSMTTPTEFSNAVLPHGTTTIVADCHEVANVFGLEGLLDYMDLPSLVDVFYAIPSSVPSTSPELETNFGSIDVQEITTLCQRKDVIALGEIMNASDLFSKGENRTKRIIKTFKAHKPGFPIEGHCPRITAEKLSQFIAAGVDSDHTHQSAESIKEKASAGMFLEIQRKSINAKTIKALCTPQLAGKFCFCTDDVLPDVLVHEGHLDAVLREALQFGMPIEQAIYAATYSPSQRMQLFDRGQLAPGRRADFILLDDLQSLHICAVYKDGKLVYEAKTNFLQRFTLPILKQQYVHSIHRTPVTAEQFDIMLPPGQRDILVIEREEHTTFTRFAKQQVVHQGGPLDFQKYGLNILSVVERYGHQAPIKPAFIKNGLTKPGAICSSWAHDSHNLLVLATSVELAVQAVNLVIRNQGGIALVDVTSETLIPLQYGGIVSIEPIEILSDQIQTARSWLVAHGYKAEEEIMNFAVLALPVSPQIKISDKGLVDVVHQKLIDWKTYKDW
ncbi:MAG: adenine deaminase C-terminal domain-containing protein, partial [Sphaerochaetaceae bacterium]